MPRISVIQINVDNMDDAIEFYSNKLGFPVASKAHYPDIVKLDQEGGVTLLLYRVAKKAQIDYPNVAQTLINVATDDLVGTLERLKKQGVEVLHKKPEPCPVGIYAGVRDPAGNVLELIEYQAKAS